MTHIEATDVEAAELTAAGWVSDVAGGRTHWLHHRLAPVLGMSTKKALEKHRMVLSQLRNHELDPPAIDVAVMARLRPPFTCEYIRNASRWRIADANDDAVASCAAAEEGYARLIVQALNENFARRNAKVLTGKLQSQYQSDAGYNADWNVGDTDLIELLWTLEGKVVRITIEEVP